MLYTVDYRGHVSLVSAAIVPRTAIERLGAMLDALERRLSNITDRATVLDLMAWTFDWLDECGKSALRQKLMAQVARIEFKTRVY